MTKFRTLCTSECGAAAAVGEVGGSDDALSRRATYVRSIIAEARAQGRNALDESAGKRILSAFGIEVPRFVRAQGPEEVDAALDALAPPLALKIISPGAVHKSDIGGVKLNLAERDEICKAMGEMREAARAHSRELDGFLIEEMVPAGHNVVIGGIWDRSFGPLVMFGLGGIFVELLRDVAFRICPITRLDAEEMIHELRGAAILSGARGGISVDEASLVKALIAIGGEKGLLLTLGDELAELDVNPLIASQDRLVAVDARFILMEGQENAL